jgi:hypothetical protein
MERVKLKSIGIYENGALTIYHSHLDRESTIVLWSFDEGADPNAVKFSFPVLIGEGSAAREVICDWQFPFLKNISAIDKVQDVVYAIKKFCTGNEADPIENCSQLWYFRGKLVWASRPARNLKDHELICLFIEEHVFNEDDEILRLKSRVERLRRMSSNDFSGTKRKQIDDTILAAILQRDKNCCFCGADDELQFDHILPVSHGGNNEIENLRILCRACNSKRGNLVDRI